MKNESFDFSQPFAVAVREILFREWDPCLVSGNDDMIDEYDRYVPAICRCAIMSKSAEDIAYELELVGKTFFGYGGNRAKNLAVAQKLADLAEAAR